ncbi:MAG: cobalamin-dependent protein [Nitrospirae bacterium]|nr:cobalamin-dependent protein [Nitrospirota bacterium]
MAKISLICLYDNWALGLRTLSNALVSKGHEVSIIHFKLPTTKQLDFYLDNTTNYEYINSRESHSDVIIHGLNRDVKMWTQHEEEILGDLLQEISADLIGLSVRSVYEDCIDRIMFQMKRIQGAITVAGGIGTAREQRLYLNWLDYVCIGEGEATLLNMANAIDTQHNISTISNLAYLKDGKVFKNQLAYPDDSNDYFYVPEMEKVKHFVIDDDNVAESDIFLRNVNIPSYLHNSYVNLEDYVTMFGRGCVGSCTFCSANQYYEIYREAGIKFLRRRCRDISSIIEELRYAKHSGYKQIMFMDSFFMGPLSLMLDFFKIYRREINLPFFAQLHPIQVLDNPEILDEAYKAGLLHCVVGIQSGSEWVNTNIFRRHVPNDKLIQFAEMLTSYDGLAVDYHILTHNPFECDKDFDQTLDLLARLPKKNGVLYLLRLRPYHGTDIFNMIQSGIGLRETDVEKMHIRAVLCLFRFNTVGSNFESVRQRVSDCDFKELKELYKETRHMRVDCDSWIRYGEELHLKGNFYEAKAAFDNALELDETNWHALSGKGWSSIQLKEFREATDIFKKASRFVKPYNRQGRNGMQIILRGLGWSYYFQDNYPEAIKHFNESLVFTYANETVVLKDLFMGLGWAHLNLKYGYHAERYFKEAMKYIEDNDSSEYDNCIKGLNLARKSYG